MPLRTPATRLGSASRGAALLTLLAGTVCQDVEVGPNEWDPEASPGTWEPGKIRIEVDLEDLDGPIPRQVAVGGRLEPSDAGGGTGGWAGPRPLGSDRSVLFSDVPAGDYDAFLEDAGHVFVPAPERESLDRIPLGIGGSVVRRARLDRRRVSVQCEVNRSGGDKEGPVELWLLRVPGAQDAGTPCAKDPVLETLARLQNRGGCAVAQRGDLGYYHHCQVRPTDGPFWFYEVPVDPGYCFAALSYGYEPAVGRFKIPQPAPADDVWDDQETLTLHELDNLPTVALLTFEQAVRGVTPAGQPPRTAHRLVFLKLEGPEGGEEASEGEGEGEGEGRGAPAEATPDPLAALRVTDQGGADEEMPLEQTPFYCFRTGRPPACVAWGQQSMGPPGPAPASEALRVLTHEALEAGSDDAAPDRLAAFCPPRPNADAGRGSPTDWRWEKEEDIAGLRDAVSEAAPRLYAYCLGSHDDGDKQVVVQLRTRANVLSLPETRRLLLDQFDPYRLVLRLSESAAQRGDGRELDGVIYARAEEVELEIDAQDRWTSRDDLDVRLRVCAPAEDDGCQDVAEAAGGCGGGSYSGPLPGEPLPFALFEGAALDACQGKHELRLEVTDEAGNTASLEVPLVFDQSPPELAGLEVARAITCPLLEPCGEGQTPETHGCVPGVAEGPCAPGAFLGAYDGRHNVPVVPDADLLLRFALPAGARAEDWDPDTDAYECALATIRPEFSPGDFFPFEAGEGSYGRPFEWQLAPPVPGSNRVYYVCRDRAGNEHNGWLQVFLDDDAPELGAVGARFLTEELRPGCERQVAGVGASCYAAPNERVVGGKLFVGSPPDPVTILTSDQSAQVADEDDFLCAQFVTTYDDGGDEDAMDIQVRPLYGALYANYYPSPGPAGLEDDRQVEVTLVDRACNVSTTASLRVGFDDLPPQVIGDPEENAHRIHAWATERREGHVLVEVSEEETMVDTGDGQLYLANPEAVSYEISLDIPNEAEARSEVRFFFQVQNPDAPDFVPAISEDHLGGQACAVCQPGGQRCAYQTYGAVGVRTCRLEGFSYENHTFPADCRDDGPSGCVQPLRVVLWDLVGNAVSAPITRVNQTDVREFLLPPSDGRRVPELQDPLDEDGQGVLRWTAAEPWCFHTGFEALAWEPRPNGECHPEDAPDADWLEQSRVAVACAAPHPPVCLEAVGADFDWGCGDQAPWSAVLGPPAGYDCSGVRSVDLLGRVRMSSVQTRTP